MLPAQRQGPAQALARGSAERGPNLDAGAAHGDNAKQTHTTCYLRATHNCKLPVLPDTTHADQPTLDVMTCFDSD